MGKNNGAGGNWAVKEFALDYLKWGWKVMRLPPRSKKPYNETNSFTKYSINIDNVHTLEADDNLGVIFTTAGGLKDLDLDYQEAIDLAKAVGLKGTAFGHGSVIGHYLFDAPGCEAKKFNLPEAKAGEKYPRELPIHNDEPSLTLLEIRGNDNTQTMFPPSIHPCGEQLEWVGAQRKPIPITAEELHTLAGRHAVAAATLYFYPENATSRYHVRMALTGALLKSGMSIDDATLYVRQVAKLAGDPKWNEKSFAKRTAKRLEDDKKTTGLTRLIEVLQLPSACRGTFYEWLNVSEDTAAQPKDIGEPIEPVPLWVKPVAPPLPHGLLPPVIEEFAFAQGELMGADPSGLAMSALTACAAVVPNTITLQVKKHDASWLESTRMWTGLVGGPGEIKSPIMHAVIQPLVQINSELYREYIKAKEAYDALDKEERKGESPPQLTKVLISDATVEALEPILAATLPAGSLCYRDELAGWFGSMDRYAGHHAANAARSFWLEAYSGIYHSWDRVGRGHGEIKRLTISVLGGIQPEPLIELVGKNTDDGLIQRINMVMLRPATMGKDKPVGPACQNYETIVKSLHHLHKEITYDFTDEAHDIRRELEEKHLKLVQQYQNINKKLASHIGKFNGMFARMCLLWHVIEQIDNTKHWPLPPIEVDTARRVKKFLHEFLLPHAEAFYIGELGLSDIQSRLIAVAGYILAHKLERISARDIQRGDRTMRNLDRRDIERVFNHLEACGWIISWVEQRQQRHSGLPIGIVNPVVHERFAEYGKQEKRRRDQLRETIREAGAKRAAEKV